MPTPSCSDVSLANDAKPDGNSYAYCLAAEIRALKTKNLQLRQLSEGGTGANNAASAIENLTGAAGASVGQVLTKDTSGVIWSTPASGGEGGGDVTGPASSVNANIAIFDGLTGKVLADSGTALPAGALADVDSAQTLTNKVVGTGSSYAGTRIPVSYGGVPDPAPASEGQVLTRVSGIPAWSTPSGAGIGDVTGPASSTDNVLAVYNGTTGKLLKNSTVPADDIARINATQTLTYKTLGGACVWAGAAIDEVYGGTGITTYTPGDILYSTSTNNLGKLPIGGAGQVLTVISGAPAWASAAGAGLGDVSGPVSAIANNFATFDGTTGKIIKDSGKAAPAGAFVGTTDVQSLSNKTMGSGCVWNGTDVAIADGGTGASTAQVAINNLTAVSAATAGHVLTKVGSDAVWAVAGAGAGSTNNLLSVLDYGAIGNGVADDTTAIQNCINACFSTGKNMLVPAGTYLVTALTMNSDTYANHFSLFGEGRNKTIIRKYATSSATLLTIGDSTPAIFQANITIEGITFDGLNTTSAVAVRTYDMVRSSFKDCTFMRANVGFAFNGGVANQFYNCMFDACNYGVFLQWVSGMVSQPNETLFNGCQFVNNPLWGLYFTHGALVVLDACEIEGNGTSGNSSTGGIYAGSLETLAPSLVNSQGIIAQGCWFEANAGRASCSFADGRNTVRDCYFIANPNSTYDVYVSGGTYVLENCSFQNTKTNHLYETAGVSTGNYVNAITGSVTFNKTIDTAKTKVDYNSGYPVLRGYGATAGGTGILTVTFATAFATTPNVQIQIVNNDTSQLIMSEVYNVTTTGFTVRTKALTSGSATVYGLAAGVYWTAAQWY